MNMRWAFACVVGFFFFLFLCFKYLFPRPFFLFLFSFPSSNSRPHSDAVVAADNFSLGDRNDSLAEPVICVRSYVSQTKC
jgi:hypothetical protein